MDGEVDPGVGGSNKSRKSSLARSRTQSIVAADTRRASIAPTVEVYALKPQSKTPAMAGGSRTDADAVTAPGASVKSTLSAEEGSGRQLVRNRSRRKHGAKTSSSTSSSSSMSTKSSKQGPSENLATATGVQPELKQSPRAPRYKESSQEAAGSNTKKRETKAATTTASTKSRRVSMAVTSALPSTVSAPDDKATTAMPPDIVKTTSATTGTESAKQNHHSTSSYGPPTAVIAHQDQIVPAAPQDGGTVVLAIASLSGSLDQPASSSATTVDVASGSTASKDQVSPVASQDNKITQVAASAPGPAQEQRISPSAMPKNEDDKMANQDHEEQLEKAEASQQPVQPPAASTAQPAVTPPDPPQRGRHAKKKRQGGKKHADDNVHSVDSDVHVSIRQGSERMSSVNSAVQSSFCPLHVNFMTELEDKQQFLLTGAVVSASAVMFSVLVTFVILVYYARAPDSPLACVTAECLAAREYLATLLNTSKDACRDFYGYVCDSWIARGKNGRSFRLDNIAASVARINETLWHQDDLEDDSTNLRLVRHIYQECHRYSSSTSTSSTFKATLEWARKQLNWVQLRGSRNYQDLVALLIRTSLLIGFHTFVIIELLSEDSDAVLRLSRGLPLLRKLTTTGDPRELEVALRRVVDDEAKDLPRIFEMDASVADALQRSESAVSAEEDVRGPIEEFLKDLVPDVNTNAWVAMVEDVLGRFGEDSLPLSNVSLTSGADGFRQAFRHVTSRRGVEEAALYLASHLDAEILTLELSRDRVSSDPYETARFCLALAQRPVVYSWPRLAASILEVPGSGKVLESLFNQLSETSHATIASTWLAKVMRQDAKNKIEKVKLTVVSSDLPSTAVGIGDGTDPYAPLLIQMAKWNASFVQLFVKVMAFVHEVRVRSPPTLAQLVVSRSELRNEMVHSWLASSVVVPTLYQHVPYLYPVGVPTYFNYATVGALLATRVAEAIGPNPPSVKKTVRDASDHDDVSWEEVLLLQFNISAICLEQLQERLGLQHKASSGGEWQRREMLFRAQGLRLAYDTLVASFGVATINRKFLKMWPEAQAAFFARFCLLSCDAEENPSLLLSRRTQCLLPLHNMPEFGNVFNCTSRKDFITQQCLA